MNKGFRIRNYRGDIDPVVSNAPFISIGPVVVVRKFNQRLLYTSPPIRLRCSFAVASDMFEVDHGSALLIDAGYSEIGVDKSCCIVP